MTDEEIERHIGLERVRNVMEGYDREHGIDKIRRMIEEVRNEDKESIDSQVLQNRQMFESMLWQPEPKK